MFEYKGIQARFKGTFTKVNTRK